MTYETQQSAPVPAEVVNPLALYLDEIGRVPLLTAQQEVDLATRIATGAQAATTLADKTSMLTKNQQADSTRFVEDGKQAYETMYTSNLRLVVSVAKKYMTTGVPLLDLVQEGNIGLDTAVRKFDPRKGFRFSTYATWWIRQAITRNIQPNKDGLPFVLPQKKRADVMAVYRHLFKPESAGDLPSIAEVMELLSCDADRAEDTLKIIVESEFALSLDAPMSDDSGAGLYEIYADPEQENTEDVATRNSLSNETGSFAEVLMGQLTRQEAWSFMLRQGTDPDSADLKKSAVIYRQARRKLMHPSLAGIYDRFGVLTDNREWQLKAACGGLSLHQIFPELKVPGRPDNVIRRAQFEIVDKYCEICPVADQCADLASVTGQKIGIWGGDVLGSKGPIRRPKDKK